MSDDEREYRLLLRTVRYIAVAASGRRTIPDGEGVVWRRGVRRRRVSHASAPPERGASGHATGRNAAPAIQDGNSASRGWTCASCGREQVARVGRCIGCDTAGPGSLFPSRVRDITARSFPEDYLPPN